MPLTLLFPSFPSHLYPCCLPLSPPPSLQWPHPLTPPPSYQWPHSVFPPLSLQWPHPLAPPPSYQWPRPMSPLPSLGGSLSCILMPPPLSHRWLHPLQNRPSSLLVMPLLQGRTTSWPGMTLPCSRQRKRSFFVPVCLCPCLSLSPDSIWYNNWFLCRPHPLLITRELPPSLFRYSQWWASTTSRLRLLLMPTTPTSDNQHHLQLHLSKRFIKYSHYTVYCMCTCNLTGMYMFLTTLTLIVYMFLITLTLICTCSSSHSPSYVHVLHHTLICTCSSSHSPSYVHVPHHTHPHMYMFFITLTLICTCSSSHPHMYMFLTTLIHICS